MSTQAYVRAAVAHLTPTTSRRETRITCPVCIEKTGKPDRRRSMSFERSRGFFYCHKCGTRGKLFDYGEPEEIADGPEAAAPVEITEVALPSDYYPLWEEPGASSVLAADARRYIEKRVPRERWEALGVGATLGWEGPTSSRVIVCIMYEGRRVGWVGRSWDPAARVPYLYPRGMNRASVFFNREALDVETDQPAIIVEGVFDAEHLRPDGVAVLGKPSGLQIDMLVAAKRPIAVCLDGDAWEEAEMLAIRLRFAEGKKAGFVKLPPGVDPDEVPAEELKARARACLEDPIT